MHMDGVRVQTCITSPPYFGLRSSLPLEHPHKHLEIGAQSTPEQYIRRLVQVFRAVRDLLTNDGVLWIVIGDSYAARRSYQAASTKGGPKHGAAQAAVGASHPAPGVMGSGTTATVARRLQRHFIGCELNRSFIDQQRPH